MNGTVLGGSVTIRIPQSRAEGEKVGAHTPLERRRIVFTIRQREVVGGEAAPRATVRPQ